MKHETYIVSNWRQEEQQVKQQQKQAIAERFNKFKEFRQSYCDLFSYSDFCYYAELTGLKVATLYRLARYTTDPGYVRHHRPHWLRYENYLNRIA
jgi:hypothetical protein